MESHSENNGGDFWLGAAVVGVGAWIHNTAKNEIHRKELQQIVWQMECKISAKDEKIRRLNDLLWQRDAEIVRLNTVVEDQSKTIAWQQLQLTKPLLSDDSNGKGNGQLD